MSDHFPDHPAPCGETGMTQGLRLQTSDAIGHRGSARLTIGRVSFGGCSACPVSLVPLTRAQVADLFRFPQTNVEKDVA